MIGVNNFYGQYGTVIKRRSLPYKDQAVDCFQNLCNNRTGSYTCDVSVLPNGAVYDFAIDSERKQFCNDNGVVTGSKEIFVLAITHNTTGDLKEENRWAYNKIKNDDELARLKTNYPLFGRFDDHTFRVQLDTCYVIKERKKALKALGKGNLNYKDKQLWQNSMVCIRIPRIDGEPMVFWLTERAEDDPDGAPTAIIKRDEHGNKTVIKELRETQERHAK